MVLDSTGQAGCGRGLLEAPPTPVTYLELSVCKAWFAWTSHLILTAALRWGWHPHVIDEEVQDDRGVVRAEPGSCPCPALLWDSALQATWALKPAVPPGAPASLPWRDLGAPKSTPAHVSNCGQGGNSLGFRPLLLLGPGGPYSPALGLWGLTQVPRPLSGTRGSGLQFQPKSKIPGLALCGEKRGFPRAVRTRSHLGSGHAALPASSSQDS